MLLIDEFRYIVIDNFYLNIDLVRKYALSMDFTITGNYPGVRTESAVGLNSQIKDTINFLFKDKIKESEWDTGYSGSFQSVFKNSTTWVHGEQYNHLNAILFLNEDPPLDSGTAFFRDPLYNSRSIIELNETQSDTLTGVTEVWEEETFVPGLYNRLLIFNSKLWHAGRGFFGDSLENSRLTQSFFIILNESED